MVDVGNDIDVWVDDDVIGIVLSVVGICNDCLVDEDDSLFASFSCVNVGEFGVCDNGVVIVNSVVECDSSVSRNNKKKY